MYMLLHINYTNVTNVPMYIGQVTHFYTLMISRDNGCVLLTLFVECSVLGEFLLLFKFSKHKLFLCSAFRQVINGKSLMGNKTYCKFMKIFIDWK